jgi:hypothetical protein
MRVIAYGISADYTDEYLRIDEDTALKCVRMFAKTLIRVFGGEYLRAPNEEDTKRLMKMNEARGGWACLGASIVCTGGGRIAPQHGMGNLLIIIATQQLSLKQWPLRICGFDIAFLGFLDFLTTSTFYRDPIYLLSLLVEKLRLAITKSMAMTIPWGII